MNTYGDGVMVGRRVKCHGIEGEVVQWDPLSSGLCDALVRDQTGRLCWFGSSDLKPTDGLGPLPSRAEAREAARAKSLSQLQAIRLVHVRDWHKPWPGCEYGKTIIGRAIDNAIAEVSK